MFFSPTDEYIQVNKKVFQLKANRPFAIYGLGRSHIIGQRSGEGYPKWPCGKGEGVHSGHIGTPFPMRTDRQTDRQT